MYKSEAKPVILLITLCHRLLRYTVVAMTMTSSNLALPSRRPNERIGSLGRADEIRLNATRINLNANPLKSHLINV